MSTEALTKLWPEMVILRPEKIIFTGGEPLLRNDIVELLRGLRSADSKHRIRRCLNSNGHLVTPDLARELVGLADEVRVSLDALAHRNDALRGNGNFEAALEALEIYRSVGFEPKVLVTVTRQSLPDLEELIQFLMDRNFTKLNINRFRPVGRGKTNSDWGVDALEVNAAVARALERWNMTPSATTMAELAEEELQCNCGVGRFLNIMPNGDVYPCHVLTQSEFCCGNVQEESLLAICHRRGLLGVLGDLDFRDLTVRDGCLSPLTEPDGCLGEVYERTRVSPVWGEIVPKSP